MSEQTKKETLMQPIVVPKGNYIVDIGISEEQADRIVAIDSDVTITSLTGSGASVAMGLIKRQHVEMNSKE